MVKDFSMTVDKKGRVISSLSIAELEKLKAGIDAFYQSHPDTRSDSLEELRLAVNHYLNRNDTVTIQDAFDRFAELRREAIKAGYVTPPISGTPPKSQILTVNGMLEALLKKMRQAIACAEPLPDEPEELTRSIIAACQAEITTAIKAINATIDNPYPVKAGGNG